MAIYVRQGETWKPRAGSVFWVRQGEQWRPVVYAHVRSAETWKKDNSYVGVPSAPSGLHITSTLNNYSAVDIAWTAPTSGASAASYNVWLLNNGGGLVGAWNTPNPFFNGVGINWDTQYIWRVWAVSSGGVQSGSYVELRYQIGHPQQTAQQWVTQTRPWSASVNVDRAYRNQSVGVNVPSRVSLDHLQINLHCNFSTASFTSASRNGVFIVAGQVYAPWVSGQANPWSENRAWGQTTAGLAGVQCQGTGWSASQTSSIYNYSGTIGATGTETYDVLQTYVTVNELNNSYW